MPTTSLGRLRTAAFTAFGSVPGAPLAPAVPLAAVAVPADPAAPFGVPVGVQLEEEDGFPGPFEVELNPALGAAGAVFDDDVPVEVADPGVLPVGLDPGFCPGAQGGACTSESVS